MVEAGSLLRDARRRRGLTQTQLARRSATTQSYIGRIERGEVDPSLSTLQRLLHAMGYRLMADLEPLPQGNGSTADLRADFERTAGERIAEAIALSEFATGVAERTATERR